MGNAVSTFNHLDKSGPEYQRLFQPILQTQNKHVLTGGPLSLYGPAFIIAAQGLFMHFLFWGLYSGLVGFSMKRMMDLHYLSITFAATLFLLPVYFLTDLDLNASKLIFFSQHCSIEYVIAIRVLAPPSFVRRWTGLIFFVIWVLVVGATAVIVSNHAVYFAITMAGLSDSLVAIAGLVLVVRKLRQKNVSQLASHKLTVEAVSGIGFFVHGISALPNPVIVVLLLKTQDPAYYFGMVWTGISMAALLASGLQLPVAAMYFKNVSCCCSRRRKIFQGEIDWEELMHEEEMTIVKSRADLQQIITSSSSEMSLKRAHMHNTMQTPHRGVVFHAH